MGERHILGERECYYFFLNSSTQHSELPQEQEQETHLLFIINRVSCKMWNGVRALIEAKWSFKTAILFRL